MGKYLITGRPGSGKTTLIRELQRRGLCAYDTDELDSVTKLVDHATGNIIRWPGQSVDWTKYRWNWQSVELRKLLDQSGDVFIGAIVGNQKEFYPLFDKIFALTLSTESVSSRLESHEHPRTNIEINKAEAVHEVKQKRWTEQGLILISSERPVSDIADEILANL